MIYQKSALGMQEIFSSERSLNTRQRQVLVLIDGKRSIDDLEAFFERRQLAEILLMLEQEGFTSMLDGPYTGSTAQAGQTLSESKTVLSDDQINIIKQILINGADDYLGLLGRSLKEKIHTTAEFKKLRHFISMWHMAMRESKLGRASADILMEQINNTIENGMLAEFSPALETTH
jgi:hypothetical protein